MNESQYFISYDDKGVECTRPDGEEEKVSWQELEMVTIENTAGGPGIPKLIWILWGKDRQSGVVFPHGATGVSALILELKQRLVPFEDGRIDEADKATENHTYLLWQKATEGHVNPDV